MTEKPADARMNRRRQRPPFEVALRADAARIPARITAGMDKRLEAALARERPREAVPVRRESFVRPWLAGSLVGLGAAAMVVLLIGLGTAAKLYPAFLLGALLVICLRDRRPGDFVGAVSAAVAAWLR